MAFGAEARHGDDPGPPRRGASLAGALEHVNSALDRRGFTSLGNRSGAERDAAIASTVAVSLEHLSEEQCRRHSELAGFRRSRPSRSP
jgi:hypothetical protein